MCDVPEHRSIPAGAECMRRARNDRELPLPIRLQLKEIPQVRHHGDTINQSALATASGTAGSVVPGLSRVKMLSIIARSRSRRLWVR
jgi:hypothetical protein